MNAKQNLLLLVSINLGLMMSCTKDETPAAPPAAETPPATVTPAKAFTHATMRPWFDTNCASCHAAGTSDARKWLYNPADYTTSIKNQISSIYKDVVTKKSMPIAPLATAELTKFTDWYRADFPAE